MTKIFMALTAVFFAASVALAQQAETLFVAYNNEIRAYTDINGDGRSDEERVFWWQPEEAMEETEEKVEAQFASLAEGEYGSLYAGSQIGLWVFRPWSGAMHYPIITAPGAILPREQESRVWIGGLPGPVESALIVNNNVWGAPEEDLPALNDGPRCRQFAEHELTHSLLCIGEETSRDGARTGLWVTPRTFIGLDWANPQFLEYPDEGFRYMGLVANEDGVYVAVTMPSEKSAGLVSLVRVDLVRSGFGEFSATYHDLGGNRTDSTLTQPITIGRNGIYMVFVTPSDNQPVYQVWRIDPKGLAPATLFLPNIKRPGAIQVCRTNAVCRSGKG